MGGGRQNVSGRYPSKKMGVIIQFESHRVRKIAAITLTLWKKGECFDAGYVKRQAA